MIDYSEEDLLRYSRHILLQEVGVEGQERIRQGKVLIVGLGGLGSPVALYLAAAGVGTIGLVDGDAVDLSNLQRQVIHSTPDVGRLQVHADFLSAENALELIRPYDFIVDGTDNFPVKFLINDACVMAGKPFSHGGILRFEGQTFTHLPGTACYRCLYGAPPPPGEVPACSQAGVLGAIAGMLGTIQAAETLKFLTGVGELLTNQLLTFDAKTMDFQKIQIPRNHHCPLCGEHPSLTTLRMEEQVSCSLR